MTAFDWLHVFTVAGGILIGVAGGISLNWTIDRALHLRSARQRGKGAK